jgi:transposase
MDGSISLSPAQRKTLLTLYRRGKDRTAARRAHIVLLLSDGWTFRQVQHITYASADLVSASARRFRQGGAEALSRPEPAPELPDWLRQVAGWLTEKTPQDFGYFRSRWSCDTLAEVLAWETGTRLSAETVRRGLRRAGFVWRRPRPVLGPRDPDRDRKLAEIGDLLGGLRADEVAVFQDEVDVHLNPKIGACWMARGQQAEVVTPGQNVKRQLAGSLTWGTGRLLVSAPGVRRNAELFVAHLDDLRRRLRRYRVIHVICDNAPFHDCRRVREYLAVWGRRVRLHFLPKYAPDANPIEHVWWRLHERITRNHRCQTIEELLGQVATWVETQCYFRSTPIPEFATAL